MIFKFNDRANCIPTLSNQNNIKETIKEHNYYSRTRIITSEQKRND